MDLSSGTAIVSSTNHCLPRLPSSSAWLRNLRATPYLLPFPVWRDAFIKDGDLETARRIYALLSPEPLQPSQGKLDLRKFYSLGTPKSYINCTEDIALPPGEWGWHSRMSKGLGLYRLVQVAESDEVMFTNPSRLAEKIVEAGRD